LQARSHVARPHYEEPDALIAHVRICGGWGRAISLFYPTFVVDTAIHGFKQGGRLQKDGNRFAGQELREERMTMLARAKGDRLL